MLRVLNLLFQDLGLSSVKREQRRGLAWRRHRVQHVLAHELQPQLQTPISGRTAPHRMKANFVDFDTPLDSIFPLIVRRQPIGVCTRLGRKTQRTDITGLRTNWACPLRTRRIHGSCSARVCHQRLYLPVGSRNSPICTLQWLAPDNRLRYGPAVVPGWSAWQHMVYCRCEADFWDRLDTSGVITVWTSAMQHFKNMPIGSVFYTGGT